MQRSADIPPRLKTLLMLVDGKTPKSKLVKFLPNFGDVESLIEALEVSGYITSMPNFLDTVPMSPFAAEEWAAAEEMAAPAARHVGAGAPARAYAPPPAPRFEPPPAYTPPPAPRVTAHDEQQLQRFAAQQQPSIGSGGNSVNLKQATQLLCDNLSDVGSLDAIDLMVRVERCQSPQELRKYLKAFHQLCVQAMGNKLADDKLRIVQQMLG